MFPFRKQIIFIIVLFFINEGKADSNYSNKIQFISNFFNEYKSAVYVVGFICWPKQDVHDMILAFTNKRIRVAIPPWNNSMLTSFQLSNYGKTGILVELNCPESDKLLDQASQQMLFNSSYHWLLIGDSSFETTMLLNDLHISVNAEITLAENVDETYVLNDIYSLSRQKKQPLIINNIGNWTKSKGMNVKLQIPKYRQRNNFYGMEMIVATVINRNDTSSDVGSLLKQESSTDGITIFTKYHNELILICQEMFNYSIKYSVSPLWDKLSNGFREGLLGQIERREVDLSGSGTYVKDDRRLKIDIVHQSWNFETALIFRVSESSADCVIMPFDRTVWIISLMFSVLVTMIIKITLLSDRKLNNETDDSWATTLLNTVAVFCRQGVGSMPHLLASRFTWVVVFASSLLLHSFYTSSVVIKVMNNPTSGPQTLTELAHSEYVVVFEDTIYIKTVLEDGTLQPGLKELKALKVDPPRPDGLPVFTNNEEGIKLVKERNVAYHTDTITAYPIISKIFQPDEICQLYKIYVYDKSPQALVVSKYSPFTKMFSIGLNKAREYGIISRTLRKWRYIKPKCAVTTSKPATFGGVAYALYMLLFGQLLSYFLLLLEILHSRSRVCSQ